MRAGSLGSGWKWLINLLLTNWKRVIFSLDSNLSHDVNQIIEIIPEFCLNSPKLWQNMRGGGTVCLGVFIFRLNKHQVTDWQYDKPVSLCIFVSNSVIKAYLLPYFYQNIKKHPKGLKDKLTRSDKDESRKIKLEGLKFCVFVRKRP